MDEYTIGAGLRALHLVGTSVLVGYYVATTLFTWLYPGHERVEALSWRKRTALVMMSAAVMLTYVGQGVVELRTELERDDGLVYAISQTLFWLAVLLVLVGTEAPNRLVYIGTVVLNIALDLGVVVGDTLVNKRNGHSLGVSMSLEVVRLLVLTTLLILMRLFRPALEQTKHDEETQSLLGTNSSFTPAYGSQRADASDTGSCDESDSDDEEKDEKDLVAKRKQHLESDGWIGYIKTFRVLVPYVVPLKNRRLQLYAVLIFINLAIERVLNVLYPRQLGIIVDRLLTERKVPWSDLVVWTLFAIIKSECCGVGAVNEWLENRFTAWSRQELMSASLNHVMNLSMKFHDQKDSGEVIKAIEQAESLTKLLQLLVLQFMPAGLDVVVAMWYVTCLFDIYALFIIVAMIILFAFATYHLTLLATTARRLQSRKEREESKIIFESVGNWFTVSCFNRRDHMMSRLSRVIKGTNATTLWNEDLFTYMFVVQEFLEYIARFAISILAATRIAHGTSSVGTLVTLESYWTTITNPLYTISHRYRQVNSSLVDSERILQLFGEESDVKTSVGAQPLKCLEGKVEFENVCFGYDDRQSVLNGLSVAAEAGQTIALVGETGAGKSTVFKILMRFFDVSGGRIKIDGQDIRDVKLDSLRECFGIVPQDSVLFNMSILENVRYGRLDATDEEVFAACRAASIHDKILSFADGYASKVGERGVKLSGGERQRIAIARVFLKNPLIILLDEATSAMDTQTESSVQDALKRLTKGRTTIVIAHRLSTVVEADRIFVMDKGRVVEDGSHADLLLSKGRYHQLWNKQSALPMIGVDG